MCAGDVLGAYFWNLGWKKTQNAAALNTSNAAVCVVADAPPNADVHGPNQRQPKSAGTTMSRLPGVNVLLGGTHAACCQIASAFARVRSLHSVRLPPAPAIALCASTSEPLCARSTESIR